MSENLDLVRSIYAAWERGDFSSVDWADPEIEFVMGDGPDPGSFKGVAVMAAFWRKFLSAWEGYRVFLDEYRELGGEQGLVLLHAGGRGRQAGPHSGRPRQQAPIPSRSVRGRRLSW